VLAMVDEAVILEAGRPLAAAKPHARVILFGSHARGDAGPHSDLDFLVIEPIVDAGPARNPFVCAGRGAVLGSPPTSSLSASAKPKSGATFVAASSTAHCPGP
jgi:hypothetical protein